jgi:hypothetical protein
VEIGEKRARFGEFRGACFNACCRSGLPPSGASRRTTPPANPVRDIAERKVRRRQLTKDGNVEISGRSEDAINGSLEFPRPKAGLDPSRPLSLRAGNGSSCP